MKGDIVEAEYLGVPIEGKIVHREGSSLLVEVTRVHRSTSKVSVGHRVILNVSGVAIKGSRK